MAKVMGKVAGDVAGAVSDVFVAQQNAMAEMEKARQRVNEEAVKNNDAILHELDRKFIRYRTSWGRKDKKTRIPKNTLEVDLSILDMYAMGDMGERLYADYRMYAQGKVPDNLSVAWMIARTPLRSRAPTMTTAEQPGTTTGVEEASAAHKNQLAAIQEAIRAALRWPF